MCTALDGFQRPALHLDASSVSWAGPAWLALARARVEDLRPAPLLWLGLPLPPMSLGRNASGAVQTRAPKPGFLNVTVTLLLNVRV